MKDELIKMMSGYLKHKKQAGVSQPGVPTGEGPWWGSGPGTGMRGQLLGGKCIQDLTEEEFDKIVDMLLSTKTQKSTKGETTTPSGSGKEQSSEEKPKEQKKAAMEKNAIFSYLKFLPAVAALGWSGLKLLKGGNVSKLQGPPLIDKLADKYGGIDILKKYYPAKYEWARIHSQPPNILEYLFYNMFRPKK